MPLPARPPSRRTGFSALGRQNRCREFTVRGNGVTGANCELIAVPAATVIPIPDEFCYEQAASVALVFVTAWHMLVARTPSEKQINYIYLTLLTQELTYSRRRGGNMPSRKLYLWLMLFLIATIFSGNGLAAPGQLDGSFAKGGIFLAQNVGLTNTFGVAVALDSQGRILIAGQAPLNTGGQPSVVRLNSNGTLDTSFGNHGVASFDFRSGGGETATGVVVQPSGKIVIGVSSGTADIQLGLTLVRFNANGTVDTTFGTIGSGTISIGRANPASLIQQPDGRLLVAGGMQMARTTANGVLDTSFGQNGLAPLVASANSMVLQPDGKILTASGPLGIQDSAPLQSIEFIPVASTLARYNENGTLDATFGTQGRSASIVGISATRLQINGDIIAAGPILTESLVDQSFETGFAVARYTANGGVDDTFDTQGAVLTTFAGAPFASPNSVVIQSNGDIIAAGKVQTSPPNAPAISASFGLARYTSTGVLDRTFGSGGKVLTAITPSSGASEAEIAALAIDANGRLVAVGTVSQVGPNFTQQTGIVVTRYLTQ